MEPIRTALAEAVIGAAIKVHKHLGPGLYESVYESCLCEELSEASLRFVRQHPLPLRYGRLVFPIAYRADLLVEDDLVVELKCVERIMPIHHAQALTYLRLSGASQALLINFNVPVLRHGLKSFLNTRNSPQRPPIL